jgi:hypothetical protein
MMGVWEVAGGPVVGETGIGAVTGLQVAVGPMRVAGEKEEESERTV